MKAYACFVGLILLSVQCAFAQVKTKKQMEDDFEKYKAAQARDFDDFKQKREAELRRMQKEYQDYYDSMTGLKKYYTQIKDTAKVKVVDEIIQYETKVSTALGSKLLTAAKAEIQPYSVTQPAKEEAAAPAIISKPVAPADKPELKTEEKPK